MNQSSAPAAAVKPLNILIVDDSATMRALLHRVVGLADLPIGTIYQAPNGRRGAEDPRDAQRAGGVHRSQHAGDERHAVAAGDGRARRAGRICCASSSRPTARSCGAKKPASSTSTCTSKSRFDRRWCAMSSAKSPALNPTDLQDALQTALIEVSENAYFVFVEPADTRSSPTPWAW